MTRVAASEPWRADFAIDAQIAMASIAERFPELAGAAIAPLGEGWDNAAFLVGGAHVFRFPRRAVAAELIAVESRVLPRIAAALPLPISAPVFLGAPTAGYPRPFAGYRFLPGTPLAALELAPPAWNAVAAQLGEFLRALHAIDVAMVRELALPGDDIGRLDHARRMPLLAQRFAELHAAGLIADSAGCIAFLERIAPSGPRADRLALVHGDLYAAHVLADDAGVSGIIDWGDVHCGDPAVDLSAGFETLPPSARPAFFAAYGPVDGATLELARYRAIYHAALVAHYGLRIGSSVLRDAGIRGLQWSAP